MKNKLSGKTWIIFSQYNHMFKSMCVWTRKQEEREREKEGERERGRKSVRERGRMSEKEREGE